MRAFTAGLLRLALAGVTVALAVAHADAAAQVVVTSRDFTTSDGVRLHVLEAGPAAIVPSTPVLALIPGWSMPAEIWRRQLEEFGRYVHVAALDPRGQGGSQIPASGYTLERRTADVAEFLKPYPRVVLVGWSLGALEALSYVGRFGEGKLAGLVLVDSSVGEGPTPPPSDFSDRLRNDRAAFLDEFVHAIFRTPPDEAQIHRMVEGALHMPVEASIALLSYPVPREHWRRLVRRVRAPLLYVVTPQFAEQAIELQKHRPKTQVALFPNAGHALFYDEPGRFNALLDDFVESVTPPPGDTRR